MCTKVLQVTQDQQTKLPKTKGTEDAQGRQAQVLLEPRTPCPRS